VTPSRDAFVLRTATMGTAMSTADPTPPGGDDPIVDALWKAHRRRMLDIAFRILLDLGDAEDVVQEAFSRLARTDVAAIDDPEAWLVVVTSRLCVDRLRTRRRHPTDRLEAADAGGDPFNPGAVDPADQVTLVDNVTLAMHALLERLSPAERTSFVLHDVFQYPFEEVATIVGRSPAACRQLASRARRDLRAESAVGRFPVDSALQQQVSERFIEASAGGDLEAWWPSSTRRSRASPTSFPAWWQAQPRSPRASCATSGRQPRPRCCTCPSVTRSASSLCATTRCSPSSC
jgi:RNA polymerase sigma factor (sigma-70 family)